MGNCCSRDEDYESARNFESLRILIEKDIVYFTQQQKAISSETDDKEKDKKLMTISQMLLYYEEMKGFFSKENYRYMSNLDFEKVKSLLKDIHKYANIFRFAKFQENYFKMKEIIMENKMQVDNK